MKTSSFEQEEEEEAQAAAMLAVRQISLLLHRFVPFRCVAFCFVPFRSVSFRFVSLRCVYEAWFCLT